MTHDTPAAGRGARFRLIREALDLSQAQFAELLTQHAAKLGMGETYSSWDVSVRETGRKALDIEDYAIAEALDPEGRGWFWLAFGRAGYVTRDSRAKASAAKAAAQGRGGR